MSPHHPSESLIERMRRAGFRMTSQRRAIATILDEATEHLDVEEIFARAQQLDRSIHLATVYRTLLALKEKGLVDELDLLHVHGERHYYEVRTSDIHAHVICKKCHAVVEPKGEVIDICRSMLGEETGYEIRYMRLEVSGICPRCA